MLRVHLWDKTEWVEAFLAATAEFANVTLGEAIPDDTQVLVKGRVDRDEVSKLSALEAVVVPFAGIPTATRDTLLDFPNIKLYNLHHNAADTAEMAIALYLAAAKRIVPRDQGMREGKWSDDSFLRGGVSGSVRAAGKRALVLGYGAIGQRIGRICKAMEMSVKAVKRSGPFDGNVFPITELDQLLPETDALFLALPLTPETDGLLNKTRLDLLPSNAIISNIARGAIIDQVALYDSLKEGRIAAAGLDVWWNYPKGDAPCFPSSQPIHELPNVVMTPHVGGGSDASEAHRMEALGQLIYKISTQTARSASVQAGY